MRSGLPLLAGLSFGLAVGCSSKETIRHDLEDRGWDRAFVQRLSEAGHPRGNWAPFTNEASSVLLDAEDAGFVVFGLSAERLPQRPGSTFDLSDPAAIQFQAGTIELPGPSEEGGAIEFGSSRDGRQLLLGPRATSPYLDRVGPVAFDEGVSIPAAFEETHVVGVPRQFGCSTSARLVEMTDQGFEFEGVESFWLSQILPVSDRVAFLRIRGGGLVRARRGLPSGVGDLFSPWARGSSLAASLERISHHSTDVSLGRAVIYAPAEDEREGREGTGRLFRVELPLEGDLSGAQLEELTGALPVHPVLGAVPELLGVAVSPEGAIVAAGGSETAEGRRLGYVAVRGPEDANFELYAIEGWMGSERVDVVTYVPGTRALFALGATNGQVVFLEHTGSGWVEAESRYVHDLGGVAGGETVDWRTLVAAPRGDGFELWGTARTGLLAQHRTDGRWASAGDQIRDLHLTDRSTGGCSLFGWLSGADFQTLELVADEVWIGPRDCDSLLRIQLDRDRNVACVSAILPEGTAGQARAIDPGFFALARWGDEIVAGGGLPLRLLRVEGAR